MKEFNLVGIFKDDGSQTIESYNSSEHALYAFYYIIKNKKHLVQHSNNETIDVSQYKDFYIDVTVNDSIFETLEENINYIS